MKDEFVSLRDFFAAIKPFPVVETDGMTREARREVRAKRSAFRRREAEYLAKHPTHPTIDHIVDGRTFLLGLDELYRAAIKPHECGELVACARVVASVLGVAPANVPIEGYYAEHPDLTEYFRLVRALQQVNEAFADRVAKMREYQRLLEVTSSPIYGRAMNVGRILPIGHDSLRQALEDAWPDWSQNRLVDGAYRIAMETGDVSLVGLAALARDPVILAALRESVALYAAPAIGAALEPIHRYIWRVGDVLAERATRFVATFNALFDEDLPEPIADNAEEFFVGGRKASTLVGRCVCIGTSGPPANQYYHWAIFSRDGQLGVEDFWQPERWTTDRYRIESARRDLPPRLRNLL